MTTQEPILIFDTTLRDGEQSPGATMTLQEKLLVAEVLDQMGVDIIEAGFAVSSKGDFDAVQAVAKQAKNATVCSLARAIRGDIEAAAEALKPAKQPRIHTFVSTSDIHIKYQLKKTRDDVIGYIQESVGLARKLCDDVEWSPMDATRSDGDFLCKAVEEAIKAGASTINIPDTVGYTVPNEFADTITMLKNRVPNIDKAIISVHCHNDLGLAVANSLAAVQAGARQIECTINGIGERAGNTAMEEVVMALRTRNDYLPFHTHIHPEHITRASKLVSQVTGFMVQNNKAIVGANAFAHESGIHQDGVLKHAETYEIMKPETVGLVRNSLVLGKHSGRHAFKDKLQELGFNLGDNALEDAFNKFKDLADRKKHVYDDDIIAIIDEHALDHSNDHIQFKGMHISGGSDTDFSVELTLQVDGEEKTTTATDSGTVAAMFAAIRSIVPHDATLGLYRVTGNTEGIDALADVKVRLDTDDGVKVNGVGRNPGTLIASALAYINALNKLLNYEGDRIIPEKTAGVES